jgi:hypothetical protein
MSVSSPAFAPSNHYVTDLPFDTFTLLPESASGGLTRPFYHCYQHPDGTWLASKYSDPPLTRGKEYPARLDIVATRFIFRDAEAGPERRKLFLLKPYRATLCLLCEELGG